MAQELCSVGWWMQSGKPGTWRLLLSMDLCATMRARRQIPSLDGGKAQRSNRFFLPGGSARPPGQEIDDGRRSLSTGYFWWIRENGKLRSGFGKIFLANRVTTFSNKRPAFDSLANQFGMVPARPTSKEVQPAAYRPLRSYSGPLRGGRKTHSPTSSTSHGDCTRLVGPFTQASHIQCSAESARTGREHAGPPTSPFPDLERPRSSIRCPQLPCSILILGIPHEIFGFDIFAMTPDRQPDELFADNSSICLSTLPAAMHSLSVPVGCPTDAEKSLRIDALPRLSSSSHPAGAKPRYCVLTGFFRFSERKSLPSRSQRLLEDEKPGLQFAKTFRVRRARPPTKDRR